MTTSGIFHAADASDISEYLIQRSEPAPSTLPAEEHIEADVIIVGGGIVGLSAALFLAQEGADVAVLEAKHIGWGGSGRSWGQVAAAAKFMPAKVEQDFAPDIARRINAAAATGPDLVFDLIRRHAIRCDETRTGNLIAAHTPVKEQWLAATAEDVQRRGYPVQLLDTAQTEKLTGSRRYRVALLDKRGGALNPFAYTRGLARAAIAAGARVYEDIPATGLRRVDGQWRIATRAGHAAASQVLLATGAFTDGAFGGGIGREVMPVRAYQAISEPLDADALAAVLPERQPLNDTRRLFSGVRLWPDGRLHVGVDGPLFRAAGKAFLSAAGRRIAMMYPQLKDLRWAYSWGGWVDMTVDQYPRLHALAPGLWSGYGFSGRGIAIGTLMGRDLAGLASGRPETSLVHPLSPVTPLWFHALHRPLIQSLAAGYRLEDRVNDARFGRAAATSR